MRPVYLVGLFGLLLTLVGCANQEEPNQTPVATVAMPTPTAKVWSPTELWQNTVVFKQDTGFAVATPVRGQNYEIVYERVLVAYYVSISASDAVQYRQVKSEVERQFQEVGAQDLCQLRIFFFAPKPLIVSLTKEDIFATGCQPLL